MAGIPSHLRSALRNTLVRCGQFGNNEKLQALFTDERLAPWYDNLPEANERMDRVDRTIAYLHNKAHNGSNALLLLLLVLAADINPADDLHKEVKALAASVAQALDQPLPAQAAVGTPRGVIPAPPKPAAAQADPPGGGSKPVPSGTNTADGKPDAAPRGKRDFFISYNRHDRDWAEWIAWQLENEGYTTFIQAWDFRPGSNFVAEMQEAAEKSKRTIAVLSRTYLSSKFTKAEWSAALARDPAGEKGLLLPVKVRECKPKGLWGPIVYIDLLDVSAEQARERLLAGIKRGRAKPSATPGASRAVRPAEPPFPGNS